MSPLSCLHIGSLLERRASGLSEADRLRLEEHLAHCPRCDEEARVLDRVMRITADGGKPLGDAARERVIARALRKAQPSGVKEPAMGRQAAFRWGFAAAVVVGVVVLLAIGLGDRGEAQPNETLVANDPVLISEPPPLRIVHGGGRGVSAGETTPVGEKLSVPQGARIEVDHAVIDLEPGSEAVWKPASCTLTLLSGEAWVEVDPKQGQGFRVATTRFVAEVKGTRFVVNGEGVEVASGVVEVWENNGDEVIASVFAEQAWQVESTDEAASDVVAQLSTDQISEPTKPANVAGLLAKARHLLAEGRTTAARRDIARALALRPNKKERAEAQTLLAECDLVSGSHDKASRRYAEVARAHEGSPAGETALFAAARLEANAGHRQRARNLFQQYLARYPHGRFRKEAKARLRALQGGQ